MEITLTDAHRSFSSSVEHEGKVVRLRSGVPVELPAKEARAVIADAEKYGLTVTEAGGDDDAQGDGDDS